MRWLVVDSSDYIGRYHFEHDGEDVDIRAFAWVQKLPTLKSAYEDCYRFFLWWISFIWS